jgi:cytochrome b
MGRQDDIAAGSASTHNQATRVLVWDVPTRVFHWLLAASFLGAFLTAESERLRVAHVMLGYTMLGLVAFRLLWGLVGTRYARFKAFAFGVRGVLGYLQSLLSGSPRHYLGHNPAGSWAIWGLIGLTLMAGITGHATFGEIGGDWMEDLHEGLSNAMLGLVLVHVAGVLVSSLLHRENLVRAMIDGLKYARPHEGIRHRHRIVAALLLAAVAAFWFAGDRLVLPESHAAHENSVGAARH